MAASNDNSAVTVLGILVIGGGVAFFLWAKSSAAQQQTGASSSKGSGSSGGGAPPGGSGLSPSTGSFLDGLQLSNWITAPLTSSDSNGASVADYDSSSLDAITIPDDPLQTLDLSGIANPIDSGAGGDLGDGTDEYGNSDTLLDDTDFSEGG